MNLKEEKRVTILLTREEIERAIFFAVNSKEAIAELGGVPRDAVMRFSIKGAEVQSVEILFDANKEKEINTK